MRTIAILSVLVMTIGCGAVRSSLQNASVSQEDFAVTAGTDFGSVTVGVVNAAVETEVFEAHAGFCIKFAESPEAEAGVDAAGGIGEFFKSLIGCD